jgi:DNA invertase Pin-like site-specific DNA recombinase
MPLPTILNCGFGVLFQQPARERQLAVIREYAAAHNINIEKVFREHSLAGLESRPALQDLLATLHSGSVALVLVESLKSLSCDVMMRESIFAQTEPYGCEIKSVTEPDL